MGSAAWDRRSIVARGAAATGKDGTGVELVTVPLSVLVAAADAVELALLSVTACGRAKADTNSTEADRRRCGSIIVARLFISPDVE